MRIGLLVNDGCFASGVAALLDVLGTADAVRADVDPSIPAIETIPAGPKRTVRLGSGLTVRTQRTLTELDDFDVVVVPAMGTMTGPATEAALDSRTGRSVVRALRSVDRSSNAPWAPKSRPARRSAAFQRFAGCCGSRGWSVCWEVKPVRAR